MAICFIAGHPTIFCPTGDDDDVITGLFTSPSGEFQVTCTESVLTLFCLSTPTISIVGSLDVADIVSSAGAQFADTEGTLFEVLWNEEENLIFVSTIDGLLGIAEIVSDVAPIVDDDETDANSSAIRAEVEPYQLHLRSVLIFPMKQFFLVSSPEKLFVISKQSRLVLLVDWKNYTVRAKRYLLPPIDASDPDTSSCILTVLPRLTPIDESKVFNESIAAKQAVISSQVLFIMYIDGSIRRFAVSIPTAPMHSTLQCAHALDMAASADCLAVATKSGVCCFANTTLKWTVPFNAVTAMSWSKGFLAVAHSEGVSLLNAVGKLIWTYPTTSLYISLNIGFHTLSLVKSGRIEFVDLYVSNSIFSKISTLSRLYISRNSIRVVEFPRRELSFVPFPVLYCEENGPIHQSAVQINSNTMYVLVTGILGFALFSRTARKQSWEVLANKSQERRIGKMDFFGFISESLFITKSINSNEILLWSVFKRIDLAFSVGCVDIGNVHIDACSLITGKLFVAHSDRIDIYFLRTDNSHHSLQLTQSVPTMFPSPIERLFFVGSILGVARDGQGYLCSGERVCGNIDEVFWNMSNVHTDKDYSGDDFYGSDTDGSYCEEENNPEDCYGVENFFIGEKACIICERLKNSEIRIVSDSVVYSIHNGNPIAWILDSFGFVSLWVVAANSLRFISRFKFHDGGLPVSVCPDAGVFAAIVPTTMRITYTSSLHPLLNLVPEETAVQIFKAIATSPFFPTILEIYLHSCLENAMPILPKQSTVLLQCEHAIPSLLISRLLQAFRVVGHFPIILPAVFASSIRKTEPHILFPLAVEGLFGPPSVLDMYMECIDRSSLREAALLMVILQEKYGPEKVRSQFTKPLFEKSLKESEYLLAHEISHFYHIEAIVGLWNPNSISGLSESIHSHIETLLINDSWSDIKCLSNIFRLDLNEWIKELTISLQSKAEALAETYTNSITFVPSLRRMSSRRDSVAESIDHTTSVFHGLLDDISIDND